MSEWSKKIPSSFVYQCKNLFKHIQNCVSAFTEHNLSVSLIKDAFIEMIKIMKLYTSDSQRTGENAKGVSFDVFWGRMTTAPLYSVLLGDKFFKSIAHYVLSTPPPKKKRSKIVFFCKIITILTSTLIIQVNWVWSLHSQPFWESPLGIPVSLCFPIIGRKR